MDHAHVVCIDLRGIKTILETAAHSCPIRQVVCPPAADATTLKWEKLALASF